MLDRPILGTASDDAPPPMGNLSADAKAARRKRWYVRGAIGSLLGGGLALFVIAQLTVADERRKLRLICPALQAGHLPPDLSSDNVPIFSRGADLSALLTNTAERCGREVGIPVTREQVATTLARIALRNLDLKMQTQASPAQ